MFIFEVCFFFVGDSGFEDESSVGEWLWRHKLQEMWKGVHNDHPKGVYNDDWLYCPLQARRYATDVGAWIDPMMILMSFYSLFHLDKW